MDLARLALTMAIRAVYEDATGEWSSSAISNRWPINQRLSHRPRAAGHSSPGPVDGSERKLANEPDQGRHSAPASVAPMGIESCPICRGTPIPPVHRTNATRQKGRPGACHEVSPPMTFSRLFKGVGRCPCRGQCRVHLGADFVMFGTDSRTDPCE